MINDPYKVLGVSETASQDEIKSAYRRLAKKYHPDLHPDDPNAALKMNEINEAYDMLSHPEKFAKRRAEEAQRSAYQSYNPFGNYSGNQGGRSANNGYGYQGAGGWYTDFAGFDFDDFFGFGRYANTGNTGHVSINPEKQTGDSDIVRNAIDYINQGRYEEASKILMQVHHNGRDARWYYLNSIALYGYGDISQAIEYIKTASQMEPENSTYKNLYYRFASEGRTYYRSSTTVFNPLRSIGKIILFFFLLRLFFGFISLMLNLAGMMFLPPM